MPHVLGKTREEVERMSKRSKIRRSRENWKNKAIERGKEARYSRRELARVKKERNKFKKEAKEARQKLKELQEEGQKPAVRQKVDVAFLAVTLFQVARIGFRAVSRVLGVLSGYLGFQKVPCPQTIINWVDGLSIARMENVEVCASASGRIGCGNGSVWIIDISIALGAEKLLCVLSLDADHHRSRPGAPCLQDVRCIAIGAAVSWTGESIAEFLSRAMESLGCPAAFLKDGGTDLAKAVRILRERGCDALSIADVSHVAANLLKYAYGDHPLLETFLSACGKVSRKFKQTVLACLAPPKTSTKARFMNLHQLVLWAFQLLRHSPAGRAAEGSLLEKLRAGMDQLPACRSFIHLFHRDAAPLLECQRILKTQGLSEVTAEQCRSVIDIIPQNSPVRMGFEDWMSNQLHIAGRLGLDRTGLPVSSDCIESLFGVAKVLGTGEVKDVRRMAARLPALCGTATREEILAALQVSVAHRREVMGEQDSLIKQRRRILPNPGSLEDLLPVAADSGFELIAGAKYRAKNQKNNTISVPYEDNHGPVIRGLEQGPILANSLGSSLETAA